MTRERARQLAEELVGRMTVEEKAGQLRFDAPAIERLGIPAYNWWNEVLHGVARAGTATVFPQAIGLAAMFDEELQESIAETWVALCSCLCQPTPRPEPLHAVVSEGASIHGIFQAKVLEWAAIAFSDSFIYIKLHIQ